MNSSQTVPAWTLWLPVVSAVAAALLASLGTWFLDTRRSNRAAADAASMQRSDAYNEVLRWSQALVFRMEALRQQGRYDSGVLGRLENFIRRDHYTPMRVFDLMGEHFLPLVAANSRIWLLGTQQAVNLAREVVVAARGVVTAAGALPERSRLATAYRGVVGESWSEQQEQALQEAVTRLDVARAAFAELVRRETGREPVQLDSAAPAES